MPIDLLQGTLDMLILKALASGPKHGYGVASWLEKTTEDRLRVEEGSLAGGWGAANLGTRYGRSWSITLPRVSRSTSRRG